MEGGGGGRSVIPSLCLVLHLMDKHPLVYEMKTQHSLDELLIYHSFTHESDTAILGMTKLNKMGPALKELSLGKIHITMITAGVKAKTKTTTAFSGYSQQGQGML